MKMKNILLVLAIFAFIVRANCQTPEISALSKEDYLRKAKNQRIAAWVSLGGGIGMIISGFSINVSEGWGDGNQNKGLWLSYVGGAAALVSIPLFITARKNKKRAASIGLSNQSIYLPRQSYMFVKAHPTITLKVQMTNLK